MTKTNGKEIENSHELDGSNKTIFDKIKGFVEVFAGIGAIFYLLGFIIVKYYLSLFGIIDSDFFSIRYISTGVGFFLTTIITMSTSYILTFYLFFNKNIRNFINENIRGFINSNTIKNSKIRNFFIQLVRTVIIYIIILIIIAIFFVIFMSLFMALLYNNIDIFLKPHKVLEELKSPILFLVHVIALILGSNIVFNIHQTQEEDTNEQQQPIYGIYGLVFLGILAYILAYSHYVYPLIDPTLGGGKPTQIQMIAAATKTLDIKDDGTTLDRIIDVYNGKTIPMCLIDESNDSYFAFVKENREKIPDCNVFNVFKFDPSEYTAFQVNKSLIKGIIYLNSKNSKESICEDLANRKKPIGWIKLGKFDNHKWNQSTLTKTNKNGTTEQLGYPEELINREDESILTTRRTIKFDNTIYTGGSIGETTIKNVPKGTEVKVLSIEQSDNGKSQYGKVKILNAPSNVCK